MDWVPYAQQWVCARVWRDYDCITCRVSAQVTERLHEEHDGHQDSSTLAQEEECSIRSTISNTVHESWGAYMRSMTVIKIPPPLPKRKNAAAGGTNPSLASVTVIGKSKANAESPKQVARVNGMQNLQSHTHAVLGTSPCSNHDTQCCWPLWLWKVQNYSWETSKQLICMGRKVWTQLCTDAVTKFMSVKGLNMTRQCLRHATMQGANCKWHNSAGVPGAVQTTCIVTCWRQLTNQGPDFTHNDARCKGTTYTWWLESYQSRPPRR